MRALRALQCERCNRTERYAHIRYLNVRSMSETEYFEHAGTQYVGVSAIMAHIHLVCDHEALPPKRLVRSRHCDACWPGWLRPGMSPAVAGDAHPSRRHLGQSRTHGWIRFHPVHERRAARSSPATSRHRAHRRTHGGSYARRSTHRPPATAADRCPGTIHMSRRQVDGKVMVPRVATLLEPKGNAYPPRRMRVASPAERGNFVQHFPAVVSCGSAICVPHSPPRMGPTTRPMTTVMFLRMRAEHADKSLADKSLADDHVA